MKGFLILLFSISSIFLFGQGKASPDAAALLTVVNEFQESIISGDADRFSRLFFSKSVPFVGIMSRKTENSVKKDYPNFEGIAVSNHRDFIDGILDAKRQQTEKIYNIKKHTDGQIAGISFDYAYYNGRNMKQWGHEKWNLVKTDGDWLITDVVYSIHFPDVEPCPFKERDSADLSDYASAERRKPVIKKKKEKLPFDDIEEEEEYDDDLDDRVIRDVEEEEEYDDDLDDRVAKEEEDDFDDDYDDDLDDRVIEKPAPKKKPFKVFVNDRKKGPLIAGIQNVVRITYEGVAPSKINLFISTKDVEFFKQDNGSYIVKPTKKMDSFPAYIRVGNKTINYTFKVEGIPLPVARIGRHDAGKIRQSVFKAEAGLLAVVPLGSVKQGKCRIQSFIITKNPSSKNLKSKLNKGGRYEQATLKIIKSAKPGDTYVFEQIKCSCAGERGTRRLKDIKYTIK